MADIQADSFQLKTEKGLFFHSLFKMNDIDPYGSQMQKSVCQFFAAFLSSSSIRI